MFDLNIIGSEHNPSVTFSQEKNTFRIFGASDMEDAKSFYGVLINWLKDYTKMPNTRSNFEFEFTALNQSSLKMLLFVFQEIKSLQIDGYPIKVSWFSPKDQNFIKEMGQDISAMTDVPFTFIQAETIVKTPELVA